MRSVQQRRRNLRTVLALVAVLAGMTGLVAASVPLYRLFCQVTGYGGTTQRADAAPARVGERIITVRFGANVYSGLPWRFAPEQREVRVRVGEERLAFYRATSLATSPTAGRAVFNVTPLKAGQYFNKIACFCFEEQQLAAGQTADMPVSFFIDPAIEKDPNLAGVQTITLSYTFFPVRPDGAQDERKLGETAEAPR